MHEVSLANSLVELIEAQAKVENFLQVKEIIVEVGKLSHVEPKALSFAFEIAKTAIMSNAKLIILEPCGRAYCLSCEKTVPIEKRGEPCSYCKSYQIIVQEGVELKLKSLEVV